MCEFLRLDSQQNLKKHMEFEHSGRTLHLCNVCGQMCSNESSLRTHMLKHQGELHSNRPDFS